MQQSNFQKHIRDELDTFKDQLICDELAYEWEVIQHQFDLKLTKPCFGLLQGDQTLGEWDPLARAIKVSRSAAITLSWDTLVSILKHEVAHQIVSELYHSSDKHGSDFNKACDRIGLLPHFRRCSLKLDEVREAETRSTTLPPRLLRRMERLEALARSAQNSHESDLAMSLLQDMQAQAFSSSWEADPFRRLTIPLRRKRITREQSVIAGILAGHFEVDVIYSSSFCTRRLDRMKALVVLGRSHHTEMAEYVFRFLEKQIESLWQTHLTHLKREAITRTKLCSSKRAFQAGVLRGFAQKLDRQKSAERDKSTHKTDIRKQAQVSTHNHGLQTTVPACQETTSVAQFRKLEQKRRKEFLNSQFPKLVNQSQRVKVSDTASLRAGEKAGGSLSLRRPIKDSPTSRTLALPSTH